MTKNSSKTKIKKSLNALVLIIVLLSFAVVGSFVYESDIITNENKITGQATGLEGVSGLATLKPEQVTIGKVDTTQPSKDGKKEVSKKPYVVEVSTDKYILITHDDIVGGIIKLQVYGATLKKDGDKVVGYDYNENDPKKSSYDIKEVALKGVNLQKWNGEVQNIPIKGGSRDASQCSSGSLCTYIDTFTDKTKTKTTVTDTSTTIEKSKTAYFYNGEEIKTQKEVDELKRQGKTEGEGSDNIKKRDNFVTSKVTEEKDVITRYEYETRFDQNKNPYRVYEATKVVKDTGKTLKFIYGHEGGERIEITTMDARYSAFTPFSPKSYVCYDKNGNLLYECSKVLEEAGKTHLRQAASRQFFSDVERVFTEFQGLAYIPTLFMDEGSLLEWRDSVDKIFASAYLGTEYWSSKICGQYLDGEDIGIAYAETPQGFAQVGAHIEATRTEPIIDENGTRFFIYKITFNVRNGDYEKDPKAPEEMNVNVVLKGERKAVVFKEEQNVTRGSSFGRTGKNAIVQDSNALYEQVCLTFDEIPFRWKLDNNELCNTIQESSSEKGQTLEELRVSEQTSDEEKERRRREINDF